MSRTSVKKASCCFFVPMLAIILFTGGCKPNDGAASETDNAQVDSNKPENDGFVSIFDGESLQGWEGDTAYWSVEGGNLVGQITPETVLKNNSFIIWRGGETEDFELKTEFRITENGNSGINYRSEQLTDIPNALR